MHSTLQSLWRRWVAVVFACSLTMALSMAWYASSTADDLSAPELHQTTTVIGRSISAELERALAYQIPLRKLNGVEPWFADIVATNPVVLGLALTDEAGLWVNGYGIPAAVHAKLAQRRSVQSDTVDGWHISTLPVRSGVDKQLAGWMHVVGDLPDTDAKPWLGALIAVAAISALSALLLRQLVHSKIALPVRRSRDALIALAGGQVLSLALPAASNPAKALQATLALRLRHLLDQSQQILLKIGEVRAAHFDPQILQQLDELAAPLVERHRVAHLTAQLDTNEIEQGMPVVRKMLLVALCALLAVALGLYTLMQARQASAERELMHASEQALLHAWRATLDEDRAQLDAALLENLGRTAVMSLIERHDYERLSELLSAAAPAPLTLTLCRLDGSVLASSADPLRMARPDRIALTPLRSGATGISGVWQNFARDYQSGAARRFATTDAEDLALIATQPLQVSMNSLEKRIGVPVALADLRGQSVFDNRAILVDAWRSAGRRGLIGNLGEAAVVLSPLELTDASGHMLGTLVAGLPHEGGTRLSELGLSWVAAILAVAAGAGLLLYLANVLTPLAISANRLTALAQGEGQVELPPAASTLHIQHLNRSITRIEDQIEAFNTLRRSRDRQGQRQARFIRQQMMQLASRLDDEARAGILQDLERIEHAGKADPGNRQAMPISEFERDPRLEKIVDEVGILALGFQNLVSRVGDQYQELDRLVAELREALRVKTQFIAIQHELEIARKMQLSILPRTFQSRDGLELDATMLPAKEIGGDFYDFFPLDAHHVAFTVADVSGKGVPAALFMAVSRTLLRAVAQFSDSPSNCLVRLNDMLASDNDQMMFVTLFYAVIDTRDGSVIYANAGHNPPYLLRSDGTVEAIPTTGGMALAIMEGIPYQEHRLVLQPGDGIFMYTDGVTEAFDPGQKMFGETRLVTLLQTLLELPVRELPNRVIAEVKAFEAGGAQTDDITCLIARYRGQT